MPTFNLFPLCINFGNSTNYEVTLNKNQYGDGGVIARGLKGIKPISQTRVMNVNTTKFDAVDTFIGVNQGQLIRLRYEESSLDDGKLYRLLNYSWRYLSPDVRGFSGEFKEVKTVGIPAISVAPIVTISGVYVTLLPTFSGSLNSISSGTAYNFSQPKNVFLTGI